MRSVIAALVLSTTLTGCAGMMNPYVDLSPEQISAAVKDKNLTAWCLVLNSPYGRGITSILNLDKAVLPAGSSISVDEQCKIFVTTGGKP